jgi:S1-C subfamily serine protease
LLCGIAAAGLLLSACSSVAQDLSERATGLLSEIASPDAEPSIDPPGSSTPIDEGLLQAFEGTLGEIYNRVNSSVVNIRVTKAVSLSDLPEDLQIPFGQPEPPDSPDAPDEPFFATGLGSGFVWDDRGHIVTNNHVVEGAERIEVAFSDGTSVPAELVGADPDTDLAVVKIDPQGLDLKPVVLGDSSQVGVGELAIAIGNPFGLQGTMTTGIISALGRSLPAEQGVIAGPSFVIPEVIQTDAAINPGNSGGVLVNDRGQVIGVTTAIESPVAANSGVGFAVPASFVSRVVPALIETGQYEHPYLGISGSALVRELAEAMGLESGQRGALVREVSPGGPADEAGLQGSSGTTTIDGVELPIGGDVIVSINGSPVESMDDLITYLMGETAVGDEVELVALRGGDKITLQARLVARPEQDQVESAEVPQGRPVLGIEGVQLTPEINSALDLPAGQAGVLIVEVQPGSPADGAGLRGGTELIQVNGESLLGGGDVITAVAGESVSGLDDLRAALDQAGLGAEVNLTLLRDGSETEVTVTLNQAVE